MRLLKRNCTTAEYLPYTGTQTDIVMDENQNVIHTGEFRPMYGKPVTLKRVNISTPTGHAAQMFYGKEALYTHVMLVDKPETEITEHGRVRWNGHTYSVTAVRQSLNMLSVALKKESEGA